MTEGQKICTKKMHGIQSINLIQCYSAIRKNKGEIYKVKYINDIIQDLEHYGPAGLIHIAVLSSIIKRPIKIWNVNGSLNKIIGKRKTGHPVDIEFHATDSEGPTFYIENSHFYLSFANPFLGHWTLRGNKDPDNVVTDLNSCLFSVIGSQIEQDPLKLRKWTVLKLKNNFQNFAKRIYKIKLKKNIKLIGGARHYDGKSPECAKEILNSSDNEPYHCMTYSENTERRLFGHPRGHALHDSEDCIYRAQDFVKHHKRNDIDVFLSRSDQDYIAHLALKTKEARACTDELNDGKISAHVAIPREKILEQHRKGIEQKETYHPALLPNMQTLYKCNRLEPVTEFNQIIIVMKHHVYSYFCERYILIHTLYPTENNKKEEFYSFQELLQKLLENVLQTLT
ncbi:PREDICTED: uncharacterized protein LOC105561471 [Vollenhovia emeryi]|uniref:uncharacterized protein LOC105561471 n=1 Tax=Vollenhovia emeryi TaxID=411798 RepID=UPI0005F49402|nr:PREDICTED: uncharacterized protein LOC105561471 [Vollenhovia emeryi]